jgi:non-ribosomal peptide synthetase component E (peptide arylation enzyme)
MSELEQRDEVQIVEETQIEQKESIAQPQEKLADSEVETKVVEQTEVEAEEVVRIDDDQILAEVKEARKRIRPQVIKRAKIAQTETSEKPKNVQTSSVYSNRFWGFLKGGKKYGD